MKILLIAPQGLDRGAIIDALTDPGHEVAVADSAPQAMGKLSQGVDLVVLDLVAADTIRFLRRHVAQRGSTPVVCIADRRKPDASSEALRLGVADIVGRPVRPDDVLAAMANATEMVRLAKMPPAAPELPERSDAVFGASPAMRDVLAIVRRVAQSRCTVLVVGERGTGREMTARTLHEQSARRDRPFVKIVCADASSPDCDRLLDGGVPDGASVYLEDIEELAPDLQARFEARLRFEEPVDADAGPPDVPPRFIASAGPLLAESIDRGSVRGGLIDAIGVVRIDLPPLRQRSQDIPLLATHFLKEACRKNDHPVKTFSRSALTLLAALPWPGNAGELRSLTERLVVLVPRGVVLLEDVLANVRLDKSESVGRMRGSLKEAREEFERDYVTAVLQHHKGRMGPAARELGIERTNLYRKIRQLKIRWTLQE